MDGTNQESTTLWRAVLRQSSLVLLVAVVATIGLWFAQDDKLPLVADVQVYELELAVPLVSVDQALALFDEGNHLFVDTRTVSELGSGTIPGAFLVRPDHFDDDLHATVEDMYPEDPLVLYGSGNLVLVNNVATRLLDRGYSDLLILQGGIDAWQTRGGDISHTQVEVQP